MRMLSDTHTILAFLFGVMIDSSGVRIIFKWSSICNTLSLDFNIFYC